MDWRTFAENFNRLLNIEVGAFGASPRRKEPGAGVLRARRDLAAHRKAQAERLRDAMFPVSTRQQNRSYAIRGR